MRRFIAVAFLLPMLVACDDDPTSPDTSHIGVYQLQTVNGEELPVSLEEDGGVLTALEGSITVSANGTFSLSIDLEFTEEGGETTAETMSLSGTYTRAGTTLTFDHTDEAEEGFQTGTLSGDVLTTAGGGGEVLVFEK